MLISALKGIMMKCDKGMENEKIRRVFDFAMVKKVAEIAIDCLIWTNNCQKVTSYMPNECTVFCNKYPGESSNSVFKPSKAKIHVLADDRLVSIVELALKNGLYDILTVVRDSNGAFAYRAQMMCSLEQITEFLQNAHQEGDKTDSTRVSAGRVSAEGEKQRKRPEKLVCDRPISFKEEGEDEIDGLIKDETKREEDFLAGSKAGSSPDPAVLEQKHRETEVNKSEGTVNRIFLRHFQFLHTHRVNHIMLLGEEAGLRTQIELIDALPVRECFTVPLLYLKNSDASSYETNYMEDTGFNDFVGSLGIALDHKHVRTGNFNHLKDKVGNMWGMVYSANCTEELVFLCPSLRAPKAKEVFAHSEPTEIGAGQGNNGGKGAGGVERTGLRQARQSVPTVPEVDADLQGQTAPCDRAVAHAWRTLPCQDHDPHSWRHCPRYYPTVLILSLAREDVAPLLNNTLVNRVWLPVLLRATCLMYQRYTDEEPTELLQFPLESLLMMQHRRSAYCDRWNCAV